jgi:hypothetical protein
MTGELCAAALAWAAAGCAAFPLHYPVERTGRLWCSCGNPNCRDAAKHPYARHAPKGLLSATVDPRLIDRWWHGAPFNIGLRTGAVSGIVAVDVDPRHDGDGTLTELERRFGPLPRTWRFLTGGGEHILFRHPGRPVPNDTGTRLGPGLDVRGDGGYIVAPPSRHISGRYYSIDVDHHPDETALAEMPGWLATMLCEAAARPRNATMPESWRKLVSEGVSEGRRNDAVARLAGHLLRRCVDPHVVLDLVMVWNAARCRPPLDAAEVARTVNSIIARESARRQEAANA